MIRCVTTTTTLARARPILGLLALFSGIALLLNILGQIDLRLAFAGTTLTMLVSGGLVLGRSSVDERATLRRAVGVGAASGVVATITYDIAKYGLGVLDPSPFDPFHAIAVFGADLAGPGASPAVVLAAGWAFHLVNGTAFGVAYTLLFGITAETPLRRAMVTGLGWGLFLESFQITLYPGWLDIRAYQEFVVISASAHLVYGATLGALTRDLFRRRVAEGGDR